MRFALHDIYTGSVSFHFYMQQKCTSNLIIFLLRQPMTFSSNISYGMSGLAPLMHGLPILRTAQLSYKLRGQEYVRERLKFLL